MRLVWLIMISGMLSVINYGMAQSSPHSKRIHWNQSRGYAPFNYATPSGIVIDDTLSHPLSSTYLLPEESAEMTLRFMAANNHNHPSKTYQYYTESGGRKRVRHPEWGFFVKGVNQDSIIFTVKTEEKESGLSSESTMIVRVRHTGETSRNECVEKTEGVDVYTGSNYWYLTLKEKNISLYVGNRGMSEVLRFPITHGDVAEFGFITYPGAFLTISNITLSLGSPQGNVVQTDWSDPKSLSDYLLASKDEMEGYWTVFDRNLEESLLQLGGDYGFAMVKDGEDYVLIYLTGARLNADLWNPGMVKARLTPDFFPGIYKVEWIDSQALPLSHDIKAQTGEGNTLTIQFPYQSSSVRLRKITTR